MRSSCPCSSKSRAILNAFEAPIARPRTSFLYQCGLVLVAVTMVLLVLAYIALIGLVAYWVYYHGVHHWSWVASASRQS